MTHKQRIKRREKEKETTTEQNMYRDDLRARVEKLEGDKNSCQTQLLGITAELAAIKTKLDFIERENERLLRR